MAKKQKKNLQKLLAKKRQLQQVGSNVKTEEITTTPAMMSLPTEKPLPELSAPSHTRELTRTFISIVIIAAVLVGVIIFDHKSPELQRLGDWLYTTLRLKP